MRHCQTLEFEKFRVQIDIRNSLPGLTCSSPSNATFALVVGSLANLELEPPLLLPALERAAGIGSS